MPAPPKHTVDVALIAFPSDRITLGDIRRLQPTLFSEPAGIFDQRLSDIPLFVAAEMERALAHKAFAAANGQTDPLPEDDRQELILLLNGDYCRYGLSSGMQQTYQMVRDFERAAALQAKSKNR